MITHKLLLKIKRIIFYIYNKNKYRGKLKFNYSSVIKEGSSFEGMNKLYGNTSFRGIMGYGSYIGNLSNIDGKIGRFTSIAGDVQVIQGRHPYTHPYVSTNPMFYSLRKQNGGTFTNKQTFDEFSFADEEKRFPVIIGSDCWIGQGAKIIAGVKIADGAVILAGTVVTKNVPPYAIVGGIPGKILKYRYDIEIINRLLVIKWWDKDLEWIKQNYELFGNIETFMNSLKNS